MTSITTSPRATAAAKLPAIVLPASGDPAVIRALRALKEHAEARQGALGNPWERAATMRDLEALKLPQLPRGSGGGMVTVGPDGRYTVTPVQSMVHQFAAEIYTTKLYKDLVAKIDDPARFDALGTRVKALLLPDLNEIAAQRGADIQRVEHRLQSAQESFAAQVTEVTAAVAGNTAAVRQTLFAFSDQNRATAGAVTTITARLDDFDGGAATIETVASALADRATGLEAQYTIKVSAGGAIAGIGLAATSSAEGNAQSVFLALANKFAFVTSGDTIGTGMGEIDPLNPPVSRVPFGIDGTGGSAVIYLNGQVRINTGGRSLEGGSAVSIWATGASWSDATADAAILAQTGSSTKRLGDTVTIANGSSFTQARYWSGSAWVNPGVVIDGNLLVSGTVSASVINGGTLGGVNLEITGNSRFKGAYNGSDGVGAIYANETAAADIGAVIYAGAVGGVLGKSSGSTAQYAIRGLNTSTASDAAGVSGETSRANTFGGFFKSTNASGYGLYAENDLSLITPGVAFWCNGKMKWGNYTYDAPAGTTDAMLANGTFGTPAAATYAGTAGEVNNPGNAQIIANGGAYKLVVQTDRNVVLYDGVTSIWSTGTAVSDRRLKKAIRPTAASGLDLVNALNVVDHQWRAGTPFEDGGKWHTNFIAQEVAELLPDAVRDVNGTLHLHKQELMPHVVKAVQELSTRLKALEEA